MVTTALIIIIITLMIFVYLKGKRLNNYWPEKGVPSPKASIPFLGNIASAVLGFESFIDCFQKMYNKFPNQRYFGFRQLTTPVLFVKDLDLLKRVLVKDFDNFVDHRALMSKDVDPIFARTLIALFGEEWRDMRSTMSPAFTSSKMRIMFSLIAEASQQFNDHFLKQSEEIIEIEAKDTFGRFTTDTIATVAFGLKCDSLENKSNEFYKMGRQAMDFGGLRALRFFAFNVLPVKVMQLFKIRWFDEECTNFFSNILLNTMKIREEKGIIRPDMIHMMMEARKGRLQHEETATNERAEGFSALEESHVGKHQRHGKPQLCDEDIIAQALIFFLGGFDSVSTALSFMAYELVVNPEVQVRLQNEIDSTLEKCDNGTITYEALQTMKYMDMVVSETLRKWPPLVGTDRTCTKDYTIEPERPEEKPLHLKPGDFLGIPIYLTHRDPKYYPDPDKFDPERFNEENKKNIKSFTYMPFGMGPRSCIGSRLALIEMKTVLTYLLSKFSLVQIERTQIPVKLNKRQVFFVAENGLWIGVKKR